MAKNLPILAFLFLMIFSGCAPIIPQELKRNIGKNITIHEVVKNPDAYKGKMVLWGGEVLRAVNKKEGTMIEVL